MPVTRGHKPPWRGGGGQPGPVLVCKPPPPGGEPTRVCGPWHSICRPIWSRKLHRHQLLIPKSFSALLCQNQPICNMSSHNCHCKRVLIDKAVLLRMAFSIIAVGVGLHSICGVWHCCGLPCIRSVCHECGLRNMCSVSSHGGFATSVTSELSHLGAGWASGGGAGLAGAFLLLPFADSVEGPKYRQRTLRTVRPPKAKNTQPTR